MLDYNDKLLIILISLLMIFLLTTNVKASTIQGDLECQQEGNYTDCVQTTYDNGSVNHQSIECLKEGSYTDCTGDNN